MGRLVELPLEQGGSVLVEVPDASIRDAAKGKPKSAMS
jgi:hypothetical protein